MTSTNLAVVTWTCVAVIIISAIMAGIYIQAQKSKGNLIAKRRWIQQLPSLISTLGVLGTFFGITIGLIFFDTSDLDKSIPLLLEGLKTAFFTSLAGMIGSLLLSRQVSTLYDNEDKGVSDVNQAAGLITESVRKMSENNVNTLGAFMRKTEQQTNILQTILTILQDSDTKTVADKVSSIADGIGQLGATCQQISSSMSSLNTTLQEELSGLKEEFSSQILCASQKIVDQEKQVEGNVSQCHLTTLSKLDALKDDVTGILDNMKEIMEKGFDRHTSDLSSIRDNSLSLLNALGDVNASEQHVVEMLGEIGNGVKDEIQNIGNVLKTQMNESAQSIAKQNTKFSEDVTSAIRIINTKLQENQQTLKDINVEAAKIGSINDNLLTSLDALGNLDASEQHVAEEVDAMSDNLKKEIREMNNVLKAQLNETSQFIAKQNTKISNDILTSVNDINTKLTDAKQVIDGIQIETGNISVINDNLLASLDALANLDASEQHVSEEIDRLGQKMTADIDHIVVKMDSTNNLLDTKFTEFTELLAKNNTEMMVDIMKDLAQQFQTKMNEVISKLVQDNFEELKHSIDQLNIWQKENKQMVADMISNYNAMKDSFEGTSSSLADVEAKTNELVADDGKLKQLIESLNKVLIGNKTFEKIISDLQYIAATNKNNANTLNTASSDLASWIQRQKNFATGVEHLLTKLDEINKIKDYGSDFWKETRRQFSEGINLLTEAGQKLNNNVSELDKHFYSRLSVTLSNLDACIQAMYDAKLNNK